MLNLRRCESSWRSSGLGHRYACRRWSARSTRWSMLPTSSRRTTSTTRGADGLRARPGHLAGGGGSGPADPDRPGPHRDRRRGLRRLPTLRATDRLASPTGPARDHTLGALRRVALTAQHNRRPGANVREPPINPGRFTGPGWPPACLVSYELLMQQPRPCRDTGPCRSRAAGAAV